MLCTPFIPVFGVVLKRSTKTDVNNRSNRKLEKSEDNFRQAQTILDPVYTCIYSHPLVINLMKQMLIPKM